MQNKEVSLPTIIGVVVALIALLGVGWYVFSRSGALGHAPPRESQPPPFIDPATGKPRQGGGSGGGQPQPGSMRPGMMPGGSGAAPGGGQ